MKKYLVLLTAVLTLWSPVLAGQTEESIRSVAEDAKLSMTQLLNKYGYPAETHVVQTADGYLLTMYRIPYSPLCGPSSTPKPPVLVQHGLLSSSFDYIILGPNNRSLGYILADQCYDVWLGNNRGNSQSKKHVLLKPDKKEFWDFTWHELGKYDIPAMVDYILEKTKQPSLHYMGHSQGTTQFFVFGSLYPEYHKKIRTFHALSPVVYMGNLVSPVVQVFRIFEKPLKSIMDIIGIHEFLPGEHFLNLAGSEICKSKYPGLQGVCCNILFLLCGFDAPQLNTTILPAIIGHTPAGASIRQLIHYSQGIASKKFRQFDHGILGNMVKYGSLFPPEYNLKKFNIPTALYYGRNDFLAALKDVASLKKVLPNVIEDYHVPYPTFNHLDFIFATDGWQLVYKRVVEVLKKNPI